MEMTGEYRIAAPRARVWAALNDVDMLKRCIPGCEALEKTTDTDMTAKVVSKIGPVKATFTGKVRLENMNPPESYTIAGEGQGGVAGFAKGGADVKLVEDGGETVLTYVARAQIGGKLAQLGARLIDSTAKMMADQFFAKFSALVAEEAALVNSGEVMATATSEASAATATVDSIASATPAILMSDVAAATAPATGPATASSASAASASAGSSASAATSVTQWIVPIVTFIVGVIIGKYVLGH